MALVDISQWAGTLADNKCGVALNKVCQSVYDTLNTATFDRFRSASLSSAGLVIKTGGSVLAKIGASDWYGLADGVLVKIAASTDMPSLSGTVVADKFNIFAFTVDSAGTVSATMGTDGAALASITLPAIPADHCLIGFIVINPTGTGDFVGGTTALDDGTVTPNAAYINAQGAMAFAEP